ncbi:germ cell nuclear acidic protein-like [Anomaloglossus baeobatrachus]
MTNKKRFKRIIVLSDSEDSSEDEDLHQILFNMLDTFPVSSKEAASPQVTKPEYHQGLDFLPITEEASSDFGILSSDDDISDSEQASPHKECIKAVQEICLAFIEIVSPDPSLPPSLISSSLLYFYADNEPSTSGESSDPEDRTNCNIPGCFLEDILSPNSIYVTNFQETKEELVERLFHHYNKTVFRNKLPQDLKIEWSKRLTTTSGQCHQMENKHHHRFSIIQLSDKVLDSAVRLRSTLAHELCHAACWLLHGEGQDGHGLLWQYYAQKMRWIHPELPEIKKHHSFKINYNFYYQCSLCDNKVD